MNEDFSRPGSRIVDAGVGIFIAAMALYGAVWIIKAIWVWLCILIFTGAVLSLGVWLVLRRLQRW